MNAFRVARERGAGLHDPITDGDNGVEGLSQEHLKVLRQRYDETDEERVQ
jgi:hypothetical protein